MTPEGQEGTLDDWKDAVPDLASHKSEGKPNIGDLDPTFLLVMAKVMTQGLTKYPNDPDGLPNWWKGGSYRSFCASILRHALALASGEDFDRESGLPHAAHIAVDASFIESWRQRGVGVDDRLPPRRFTLHPDDAWPSLEQRIKVAAEAADKALREFDARQQPEGLQVYWPFGEPR